MKRFLFLILLALGSSGCDSPDRPHQKPPMTADEAAQLCVAISNMELANQCRINAHDATIDVMMDSSDDEVARKTCADMADKLMSITSHFTDVWQLQIFSPYRNDKALASCRLH